MHDLAPSPVSAAERLSWLRLYRSENVGPVTFFRLIDQFGSASSALAILPDLARRGGGRKPIAICSKAEAERECAAAEKIGARLLIPADPDFPAALPGLETAPLLYVQGRTALLQKTAIGIVGARNASAAGRRMAQMLAADLGAAGFAVVSGLARGIDAAAHEASLKSGTLAVMAGGVDIVYPPENERLYGRIRDEGALVSEMAPGTQPRAAHFPRRNRLISGLALGVVVVEAAIRSGSLITARFALEQGREVFAVPGSPLDARCHGPNRLIKDGAALVESAADITEVLGDLLRRPLTEPGRRAFSAQPRPLPSEAEQAEARRLVLESLGPTPVTVDEIIRQCQLSPAMVSLALLELELAGRLERHPGSRVSLIF